MPRRLERNSFIAHRCVLPHVQAVEAWSTVSFARHTHDGYGIGRLVSGAQRSWSGRGQVEAGPGDVISVNPGEVHDGTPIGGVRTWKMLYFAPEVMAAAVTNVSNCLTNDFEFTDPVMKGRSLSYRFDAVYDACFGPYADPALAEERLILLLAGLVQGMPQSPPPDNPGVARAKACIDADPAAPHTLADLARVAGASRFHVIRSFAKLTGLTPHAYLVQRRVDAARRMVRGGSTLADAAVASGFADQSHLTRAFSRRYGVTLGAYAAAVR